ncbi:MAG TPA: ABC transporter ATP-binding protein [Candidatus Moranbacteria bacterium]|nr:ABC transporter ATP-binding protein [Candidatus Moranbacteria bacterium]
MARNIFKKEDLEFKYSWIELARSLLFLFDLGKIKRRYLVGTGVLFIILAYNIVPPLIIGAVINFFTNFKIGQSLNRFYFLAIFLGGSMLVVPLIRLYVKQKLALWVNETAYQIKVKGFELMLSQSLIDTSQKTTGEKVQKIQNGLDSFYLFTRTFSNQILSAIASLVGIIAIFLYLRYTYAIFLFVYAIIYFVILKTFTKYLQKLNFMRYDALEKSSGVYVEGLSNISTLKSLGSEKHFQSKIVEREVVSKSFADKIIKVNNNQWKVFQTFNAVSASIFIFLIGRDVFRGLLNIGEIVIFYSYFDKITTIGEQVMNLYGDLIQTKAGIGQMMSVFEKKTEVKTGDENFPEVWQNIKIIGGQFLYKSDNGLRELNFKIRKGERIGVVGKTGSGKSTLAKILLGLYPIEKGKFLIDNQNFYNINSDFVFKNISVVPQEIEMFNMSFAENITLFRKIESEIFERAIQIAQLQEVIDTLPEGPDTLIGEKGYRLSGGERQRLAIARSICQNSQILILDEATSSLDSRTEKKIYEALEENFPDKTIIAIAHHIQTLEKTDRIYVFDQGKIVEEGTYKNLINDQNSFLYDMSRKVN